MPHAPPPAACSSLPPSSRDTIDHMTIPSAKGKGTLKRVDEVFDCWFESGSMPYAQVGTRGQTHARVLFVCMLAYAHA